MNKGKKIILGITGTLAAGIIGRYVILNLTGSALYAPPELYGPPPGEYREYGFNSQFSIYEGKNQSAAQIRGLENVVHVSNNMNSDHYVQYIGPKSAELKSTNKYSVKLKYGNDGYVCAVIVSDGYQFIDESQVIDKSQFNAQFTAYTGEKISAGMTRYFNI